MRYAYSWPLYDDVVVHVTFTGGPFTSDDVELLGDYLQTVIKSRQRSARKAEEAGPPLQESLNRDAAVEATEAGS